MDDVVVVFSDEAAGRSRVVTFKAEEELVEMLDRVARSRGLSRSEAIREAIRLYLGLKAHGATGPVEPRRLGALRLG